MEWYEYNYEQLLLGICAMLLRSVDKRAASTDCLQLQGKSCYQKRSAAHLVTSPISLPLSHHSWPRAGNPPYHWVFLRATAAGELMP